MSDETFVTDWKEVGVPGFDVQSLILNPEPVKDIKGLNSREVTFIGTYKNMDITCRCVIAFGDIDYHQEQYYYGYHMYREMQSCRYVTNYIGIFRAHVLDIVDFIQNPPKEPALFIVKPLYVHGTLAQYAKAKRRTGNVYIAKNKEFICILLFILYIYIYMIDCHFEPFYLLQMFISIFYVLEDAHRLNIGLVDINFDNFNVNVDYTLDFDGFESCIYLKDNIVNRKRSWMISARHIKCPGKKKKIYIKYLFLFKSSFYYRIEFSKKCT